MNTKSIWKAVLAQLEVDLSPANYKTWISPTNLVKLEDGIAEVTCPAYAKNRIEERYHGQLKKALDSVTHEKNEIVFSVETSADAVSKQKSKKEI